MINTYVFATLLRCCVYEFNGDALMPRPLATYRRKILYRQKNPKSRSTPKISIPSWWVRDTEYVELRVYDDRIIIERTGGDEG